MHDSNNLNLEEIFSIAEKKHKEKRLNAAKNLYNQILKQEPNHVAALNNLAILSNQLGESSKALNCFKKLVEINPKDFNSYNNLGVLYERLEENQKSLNCYEKAIQINPNFEILYFNQGNILKKLKELKKAANSYKKTIEINPSFVKAYYNLGTTFRALGELQKAISFFKKTTQINTQFFEAYNELGVIYNELGQYKKAIDFYEMAIKANPKYVNAYMNLGSVFKEQGEHQMAVNYYKKATGIEPENITAHWLLMNTFPKIYQNIDEIDQYEKNFLTYIKKINLLLDTNSHYTKKELIGALISSTNFFLPYQGRDILNSQIQYANLIERITKKIYKEFHTEKKINLSTDKIKIGFVSSFFRHHTVFKLFKNWIVKLDKNYFRKYIYYCDDKFDYATNEIKQNVNYFYNSIDVDELAKKIEKDKLDILIYLDIGMRSKIQILSSMRLAPIQCSTWGHPITSGFKNIDYFFSSELMENKNSQKDYTEKLINLPGLGIDYDPPNLTNITKLNIPNNSKAAIFLNLQSLFKLLPQDDHIYLDILKKNPNSIFWFIQDRSDLITSDFKKRISNLFQKFGYTFEKYSYFHPPCSQDEFFGLINESDIILDSFNWSGGNTSLEAISLDKPIVTCPSHFMRGRHTYAILKLLEIDDTIANSKEQYTEIAAKLASDFNFRESIINKIKVNKKKLFNDEKGVIFLENLLRNFCL